VRNLLKHPITRQEKLDALDWAIQEALADGGVGDVRPAALREVREAVQSQPESGGTS
jgi:hypothetical protein